MYIGNLVDKFNKFIDNLDIDNYLKKEIKEKLIQEENINKMIDNEIYNDKKGCKTDNINIFFTFLEELKNKHDTNYFKEALKYVLSDNKSTVIDKFIKYIVVTNYNDINVNINFDDEVGFGEVSAFLYGLKLGTLVIEDHGTNGFLFDWFHVRKDLNNTKIGTLIMNELIKYILHNYKDSSLYAETVSKGNLSGISFYKKYGFKDSNGKELEYIPSSKEIISIIITANRMKEVYSNNKDKIPNIEITKERRR